MKLKSILFLVILLGGGVAVNRSFAQLVSGNCYLQGRWLEIGMLRNASFGAPAPPAGYHAFPAGSNLGETYDVGHDGWAVGTPAFNGDYTYPGSPFEGWKLQINGLYNEAYAPGTTYPGTGTLTGSVTTYSNTGGRAIGMWEGTASAGGLTVRQETRVDTEASWVVITTYLHNTTAAAMPDVYYMRSCDPDNDEAHGGGLYFSTNNTIAYQNDPDHRVEVDALGTLYNDHFGLCTKDYRAKALIYTSWPLGSGTDLSTLWAGTYGPPGTGAVYDSHAQLNGDYAIGLVYKIGTIAAGDSAIISYAYIFNGVSGVDSAFPEPELWVNGSFIPPTGPAPAPTVDTFNSCEHPGLTSFDVNIKLSSDKCWTWSKWSWAPSTGLSSTTGLNSTVTIGALSGPTTYTITGTDSAVGMNSGAHRVFYLTVIPCFSATNNSDPNAICADDTLKLFAHGDSTGATYAWYGPAALPSLGPLVGTTQYITVPHVLTTYNGVFTVIRTIGSGHDTARTTVTIKAKPIITATSNGPICSGSDLILTSSPDSVGESWTWSGPAGFSSVLSDPTRTSAITAYGGTYKVIASFNGCIDSATVTAVVDSTPEVPTLGSNTPVCSGDTLKLTSIENTAGVSYVWTGPAGFTSTSANPNIPNVTVAASGVYTLTVRLGTCTNTNTTNVLINPTPVPVLGSNSTVCSGNSLNLTSSGPAGATYDWVGPNAFTSTDQSPVINPATTAATGNYSVIVTLNGCPSAPTSIYAEVDTTPQVPTVSTNSPGPPGASICETDTLAFFASSGTAGANYYWQGPAGFTSSVQNPVILNATPAASGFYTVTVSVGTCSVTAILTATVTPTPPLTAISNSSIASPICTGLLDTLFLQASSGAGAQYSWSGPYVFTSSAQNPFRTPALAEYAGVYHVTVLLDGCTNNASVNVVINETPPTPWVKWLTYCQFFDAPPLMATGSNLLWYTTSAAGAVGSPTPPVPATATTGWSFYYVTQTVANCKSAVDSIKVQVNPKPTVSLLDRSAEVCPRDSVVLTAIDTDPIAYFHWTPIMYLRDTTSATTVARPETNMLYSVVATNQYGCTDTASQFVTVRPAAVINLEDSVSLYPGETYHMNPSSNCSSFRWSPAGGLNSIYVQDPVAAPAVSTRYTVSGITEWGCKTKDSIDVIFKIEAELAMPNAFAPGNGPNGLFKVIRRGVASLHHFRIYDRWGVMVFEGKNIDDGWDGTYNGTPQPVGVYMYEISAVSSMTGKEFVKKGNITLLR